MPATPLSATDVTDVTDSDDANCLRVMPLIGSFGDSIQQDQVAQILRSLHGL